MKKIYILFLTVITCSPILSQTDTTINTFSQVHQRFGGGYDTRTVVDTFIFPSDLSMYSKINVRIQLTCPTGGCDPWDRFANLKIVNNGEDFEIARYMTPYKKACGWTVDVTDYRNMLTDTVILKSFIDTWVNPAWLVTYYFDFIAGTPTYNYVKIDNLWQNEYLVYGDTTQPVAPKLTPVFISTDLNVQQAIIRVVNTGHGQGNTNNAAEFSSKTHYLLFNDDTVFSQFLWRTDCGNNPTCNNQQGTWQYSRANWCPGKAVDPDDFDVTSMITKGTSEKYEYKLAEYFNSCSPNNPGCTNGGSCPDCNYNYNGHTEPHYKIHAQLIQRSNLPMNTKNEFKTIFFEAQVYPNPTGSVINISANQKIKSLTIFNLLGEKISQVFSQNIISFEEVPEGMYFLEVVGEQNKTVKKIQKVQSPPSN